MTVTLAGVQVISLSALTTSVILILTSARKAVGYAKTLTLSLTKTTLVTVVGPAVR